MGRNSSQNYDDLTVGDYAAGVPHIRIRDLIASFMRQMIWVLPLFLIGLAASWYLTKDFKRTYKGKASVHVTLGPEHVFQAVAVNSDSAGLSQTADTITNSEAAILKNDALIERVVGELTSDPADRAAFAKSAFDKIDRSADNPAQHAEAWMELLDKVDRSYGVFPRPKSNIIDIAYQHEDPDMAVRATNAFVKNYLTFRREIFVEGSGELIAERRSVTEDQLAQNERAIARFLKKNGFSDIDSERAGLRNRTEALRNELNGVQRQIAETETALATVEDQLRVTPATIELYVDDRGSQRVAQAELELKQLLAKYLPTSQPVRQKQTEIDELKSLMSAQGGKPFGGGRVGPNPVQQDLMRRRNLLQSSADSFREKEFTVQRQLNAADGKLKRLTSALPQYQNLQRERDSLAERLSAYNAQEQEALVDEVKDATSNQNINVIHYAKFPVKGRNMRMVMFALGSFAWGFTLFMFAMLRVFLDPRLYSMNRMRQSHAVPGTVGGRRASDTSIPDPVAAPAYADVPLYAPAEPQPYMSPSESAYDGVQTPAQHAAMARAAQVLAPVHDVSGNVAHDAYANPYQAGQVSAAPLDPLSPSEQAQMGTLPSSPES